MAELKQILEKNDFSLVVEVPFDTGRQLSRTELELACELAIGESTPNRNVKFVIHSRDNKWFLVYYVKDADKFLYEKMTAR